MGTQLNAYEATRDLAADLLESVQQMKAGKTQLVLSPAVEARKLTGLSQAQFASLLGVSVRTLLTIARLNPKALLAAAGK